MKVKSKGAIILFIILWISCNQKPVTEANGHQVPEMIQEDTAEVSKEENNFRVKTDTENPWKTEKLYYNKDDTTAYYSVFEGNKDPIQLDSGLWYIEHIPSAKSEYTFTYPIAILKIDPAHFKFELAMDIQKEIDYDDWDPKEEVIMKDAAYWCSEKGFIAAINAGMFGGNMLPVAYTVLKGEVLQKSRPSGYRHYFHIDSLGYFQVLDDSCDKIPKSWYSCLALIRMQSCDNKIVWGKQPDKQWSTACIAQDNNGMVYFVHSRSGFMVYDITKFLNECIGNIRTVTYLEGGPEASVSIHYDGFDKDFFGSFETGFYNSDDNDYPWHIPNVIGIRKRDINPQ